MTELQANRIRDLLLADEDEGATFVGADIRPANESDSVYGIPVNPDGADMFVGTTLVIDGEEHTDVAVIDPAGEITINYESN